MFLAPIVGIMLADRWRLRRAPLDVVKLSRVNPTALAALLASVLLSLPGFLSHAFHAPRSFLDPLISYIWFTGLIIGGGLYLLLMRLTPSGETPIHSKP